jgi:hypothetical protein
MFGFWCYSDKNSINVVNLFNVFTYQCFKDIMETCEIIWNEYNANKVFK